MKNGDKVLITDGIYDGVTGVVSHCEQNRVWVYFSGFRGDGFHFTRNFSRLSGVVVQFVK